MIFRRSLFLLFALLATANIAAAQAFAFVQNTQATGTETPVPAYKLQVASRVFEQLLQARGDLRQQVPGLTMNRRQRYVAWMDPDQVQIGLEEKAYDICASFGKDSLHALATLLAHELTHYYEKHDWSRHFALEHENLETARQLERIEEGLKQEAQADYLGGFLALSAGFRPYGIMPELLKKIYQTYHLPDQLPGYPPLHERLKMVTAAQKRLGELSLAFEVAQRLTLIGQYEAAANYQRYLLHDFQSRELHNNAAANNLLAALAHFAPTEQPFALPIEIDPNTRLNGFRNNDAQRLEKRKALLKTAGQQLDMALALDAKYHPAMLNKACLFVLQGEPDEAAYWLQKGQKLCPDAAAKRPFEVLQAICAALQGETEQATQRLSALAKGGYAPAATNLNILQKKVPPAAAAASGGIAEQIEQFRLADFLAKPSVEQELKVGDNVFCGLQNKKSSTVYLHYADDGAHYAIWQETRPGYAGKTARGIALGASATEVEKAYGAASKEIVRTDGLYWVYPAQALYFELSPEGKVRAWGVFLTGNNS
jgi:hypothetical protein